MGKRVNTAVWMEKYQRWQINVQKDGKRKTFSSYTPGRKGQREANEKADRWLDDGIVDSSVRVSALLDQWLKNLEITTSRSNWLPDKYLVDKWVRPKIGRLKIEALNENHLQDVINCAFKKGNLSEKTLKNIRSCMTAFVKYARKCKATTLFVEDIKIPSAAAKTQKTTLQPDDLKKLFSSAKTFHGKKGEIDEWYIYAFRFQVLTGLRPGEMCGLMNDDIDGSVLSVRRSINRYNEITDGKNKNAQRSYQLPPVALSVLEDQRRMLKATGLISPYVFPAPSGSYMKQADYAKHWERYRNHNGLTKTTPYELRHTFVSVNKSIPAPLLKSIVGHSEDMDTFGVYGHDISGEDKIAAKMINDTFEKLIK